MTVTQPRDLAACEVQPAIAPERHHSSLKAHRSNQNAGPVHTPNPARDIGGRGDRKTPLRAAAGGPSGARQKT